MNATLKLELTTQEVQVIGEALGNAPYRVAAPILKKLQEQINAQQQPEPTALASTT